QLTDNDKSVPMATVVFMGNGRSRLVDITPTTFNFGFAGVGSTVRLSDIAPSDVPSVRNMDTTQFMITSIDVANTDGTFRVVGLDGKPIGAAPLPPGATTQFDILFEPKSEGDFQTYVTVYVDTNTPISVMVQGHGVFVDARGGGGCQTGRGSSGGMI